MAFEKHPTTEDFTDIGVNSFSQTRLVFKFNLKFSVKAYIYKMFLFSMKN